MWAYLVSRLLLLDAEDQGADGALPGLLDAVEEVRGVGGAGHVPVGAFALK